MTDTELIRALAENPMSWQVLNDIGWRRIGAPAGVLVYEPVQDAFFFAETPGRATRQWDPIHSTADAFELLDAWRAAQPEERRYALIKTPDGENMGSVTLFAGFVAIAAAIGDVPSVITLAVAEAVGIKTGEDDVNTKSE